MDKTDLIRAKEHRLTRVTGHRCLSRTPSAPAACPQLVIEGSWADGGSSQGIIAVDDIVLLEGACEPAPPQSRPVAGNCHFTQDLCGWTDTTSDGTGVNRWREPVPPPPLPRVRLTDHTFGAHTGYVFFNLPGSNAVQQRVRLVSPLLEAAAGGGRACVAFRFAHLSPEETTQLRVLHEAVTSGAGDDAVFGSPSELWSLRASETDERSLTWIYGQASFDATQSHRVTFEGVATRFGFALDDVSFTAGDCDGEKRPGTVFVLCPQTHSMPNAHSSLAMVSHLTCNAKTSVQQGSSISNVLFDNPRVLSKRTPLSAI